MVTGTTASSGDHSIITGLTGLPVHSCASRPKNSVWPGSAKPEAYSTFLATGLVTIAAARPAITSATARRIEAIAAGALVASGLPGAAVTASCKGTTGKARWKATQISLHVSAGATA